MNSTCSTSLLAMLALGCSGAVAADAAFECARVEPSRDRAPAYGPASQGHSCEGFFRQNISGTYLELVSLIAAGSSAGAEGAPLKLRASTHATRFVVSPLPQGVAYRADLPNTGAGTDWPAQTMLNATGLRLAELGFLATVPDSATYGMNVAPVSIGGAALGGKTVAIVRSSVQTQEMRWRMFETSAGGSPSASAWTTLDGGAVDPWGRAYIRFDAVPTADKPFLVQVEARRPGGEAIPVLEFRVWLR